jgi:hypothetical protein
MCAVRNRHYDTVRFLLVQNKLPCDLTTVDKVGELVFALVTVSIVAVDSLLSHELVAQQATRHMYVCMYLCMYVCMFVCMYVFKPYTCHASKEG